jgi:hypothetical protein
VRRRCGRARQAAGRGGRELALAYVFGGDGHAHRGATAAHEASEGERAAALLETLREQRVSKRTCARVDLRLWDAACMSFAT